MIGVGQPTIPRDASKAARGIDFFLALSAIVLLLFGLMALYSEGVNKPDGGVFKRQLFMLALGMVPFAIFLRTPLSFWRRWSSALYAVNLAFLGLVLVAGSSAKGAQRWLQLGPVQVQPSELSKLFIVLTLASFFANRWDRIERPSTFALSFLHVIVPAYLVFKQPHLGATLTILVAWLGISIAAGVPWKYLIVTFAILGGVVGSALTIPGLLQGYQKERILAMFKNDEKGSDYQQTRAEIAIGVGGVSGTGYLKGDQKQGRYIPEQDTDFIFTVIAEEGGLIGSTLVLACFGLLFFRIWMVGYRSPDPYSRLVTTGILCVLGFHAIANLGMNLSLLPVVGLWLPLLSYGGSALWLCMASIAVVMNCNMNSQKMF